MKKSLFCFCLLFSLIGFCSISLYQNPTIDFYTWSQKGKLNWSDFKGTPDYKSPEIAITASSVEFSYYTKGTVIGWQVIAKYFPDRSWIKKDKQSPYVLQHEQVHFDITELYARLFRKRLKESVKTSNDILMLKSIGKDILRDWQKTQDLYDKETNHSINEQKQAEWNKKVFDQLQALKDFAS